MVAPPEFVELVWPVLVIVNLLHSVSFSCVPVAVAVIVKAAGTAAAVTELMDAGVTPGAAIVYQPLPIACVQFA